jgi:hypothetical protein
MARITPLRRRNRNSIIPQAVDPPLAAAAAAQLSTSASSSSGSSAPSPPPASLFDANPFAKFLVLPGGDASGLWRGEAEHLAGMASQVRVRGGWAGRAARRTGPEPRGP